MGQDLQPREEAAPAVLEYAVLTPVKGMVAKFPHVSAWWSKVSERPTWQKVIGRA